MHETIRGAASCRYRTDGPAANSSGSCTVGVFWTAFLTAEAFLKKAAFLTDRQQKPEHRRTPEGWMSRKPFEYETGRVHAVGCRAHTF